MDLLFLIFIFISKYIFCLIIRILSCFSHPVWKLLFFPYLKKGSDQVRGKLPDQQIDVTALIRFVYGPNKLPLLLTKAVWSIPYLRHPYGLDRMRIRSTLLVIRIYWFFSDYAFKIVNHTDLMGFFQCTKISNFEIANTFSTCFLTLKYCVL